VICSVVCEHLDSHFLFKCVIVNVYFLAVFSLIENLLILCLCFSAASFEW
jgi:hypothetical protein